MKSPPDAAPPPARPAEGERQMLLLGDEPEATLPATSELHGTCVLCQRQSLRQVNGEWMHGACEDVVATPRWVRRSDPTTSQLAAKRVQRSRLLQLIWQERQLAGADGRTDDELQVTFADQSPGSVSKRRCDLVDEGRVESTGMRRATRYGRPATVWRAVQ